MLNDKKIIEAKKIDAIFTGIYNLGKYSGQPAIFINLPLQEAFIEKIFELSYGDYEYKLNHRKSKNLIIIQSNEELTKQDFEIIKSLLSNGYNIIIETSLEIQLEYIDGLSIVYIPINNGFGYKKLRDDFLSRLYAIKFSISSSDENYNYIPDIGQSIYSTPVYVQPIEEFNFVKNLNNMQYSLDLCNKLGYYYCIDINKILGII